MTKASTSRSEAARNDTEALRRAVAILDSAGGDVTAATAIELRILQDVLAAATRVYASRVEAGEPAPALSVGGAAALPTATEVLVTASALLESAHVEPFELGLWQAAQGSGTRGGADAA